MEYAEKLIFLLNVSSLDVVVSEGIPILFAVEQTGSFLLLRFDWLVKQIRFALSIIAVVVTSKVAEYLQYLFASHFLTDDRYHN